MQWSSLASAPSATKAPGGIVSAVLGVAQSSFGPVGIVATLGVCIAYLFALGLFASRLGLAGKTRDV